MVSAQVLDIAPIMLLKLGLRLYPSIKILYFYYLDWRPVPESWRPLLLLCLSLIILMLWLLHNFLEMTCSHLSRRLWSLLHLAHSWRSNPNLWLLTEEILLAVAAHSQVR